jgi:hypothetical protein
MTIRGATPEAQAYTGRCILKATVISTLYFDIEE